MESISSLLATITKQCSACPKTYEGYNLPSLTLCPECSHKAAVAELDEYKAAVVANLGMIVDGRLQSIGLAKSERRAALGQVGVEIKRALPGEPVRALLKGEIPSVGFGIIGSQGAGKTMALAAILKAGIADLVSGAVASLDRIPSEGEEPWRHAGRMIWLSWPTAAAELKAKSVRNNGSDEVAEFIERAIRIPLLVVDDLGRERMRGTYTDDYSAGQLDRIVDMRAREERPMLWTANASAREMERIYGGAMVSRLVGMSPPVTLPKLPDRRLADQSNGGAA